MGECKDLPVRVKGRLVSNSKETGRVTKDDSWLPYQGPNCIAKLKERRTNKPLLLFGEAIKLESGARAQAKSPWEGTSY